MSERGCKEKYPVNSLLSPLSSALLCFIPFYKKEDEKDNKAGESTFWHSEENMCLWPWGILINDKDYFPRI